MSLGSIMRAALLVGAMVPAAHAAELPNTIAVTAYDVGSNGYNQAIAIGAAFKNEMGKTLRVLPGKNDVSRQIPLREGKIDFSYSGIGAYYSQEAVFVFGRPDWGPQPIRIMMLNMADTGTVMVSAADANIRHPSDLKGKRVAFVPGAPALNMSVLAHLRFADLTFDDVEVVEFGGYAASQDGLVNDQVDAIYLNTAAAGTYRLDSSPRGADYVRLPHDDEAGWERLLEVLPYYAKRNFTKGVHLSEESPLESGGGPYPLLIAYESKDADTVYAMTKAMYDLFPHYKDGSPGTEGWALDRQVLEWVAPYHDGAIRYYKEAGVWTPEAQKNNEDMIARQAFLAEIWKEHQEKGISNAEESEKSWMTFRAEKLAEAGMPIPFEKW